ncbi:B12-binding domain-containing radical SAM protein [Guggenheimella bovis]
MYYDMPLYRPPSERNSLIIQVTLGCSHNECSFCSMYKSKEFRIRPIEDVLRDLEAINSDAVRRIFLADGDALVLKTSLLKQYLSYFKNRFPKLERVSAYGTVQDLQRKTEEELRELKEAGLTLLYVGLESGSNEVLKALHKGVTREESIEACLKAKRAGMELSVTLMAGLSNERAENVPVETAELISAIKPTYVSYLTLHLEPGTEIYEDVREGRFRPYSPVEVAQEIYAFLKHVDSEGSVFRANHASNYLILRGTLNKDKECLLSEIEEALSTEEFRNESWRSL